MPNSSTGQFDALTRDVAALRENVLVQLGSADAYGGVDVSYVDLSLPDSQHTVRLWDESGGDYWIDLDGEFVAAWWRQDGKRTSLARVIVALLDGQSRIDRGVASVDLSGTWTRLRERM